MYFSTVFNCFTINEECVLLQIFFYSASDTRGVSAKTVKAVLRYKKNINNNINTSLMKNVLHTLSSTSISS